MGLLKPATMQQAFLKVGLMGFAGSGKTFTASLMAIGLWKYLNERIGEKRPVAFIDTETGSDFVIPLFKEAGIPLVSAKTRAFKGLLDVTREAEKESCILITDSLTHFWIELVDAYQKQHNRKRLQFQDWSTIKPMWREYSDLFVNSKLHIISCGRAGFEYEYAEDDKGKKELQKTGVKMKAETEFGFEPSLCIEMMLVKDENMRKTIHRAWVLKDRSQKLNAKWEDEPGFNFFKPHVDFLNIGGEHVGFNNADSGDLFNSDGESHYTESTKQKKIYLEEIKAELTMKYPSRTEADNKGKLEAIQAVFGTRSWTKIEGMDNNFLAPGLVSMREHLNPKTKDTTPSPEQKVADKSMECPWKNIKEICGEINKCNNALHLKRWWSKYSECVKAHVGDDYPIIIKAHKDRMEVLTGQMPPGNDAELDALQKQVIEGIDIITVELWEAIAEQHEFPGVVTLMTAEQCKKALREINSAAISE